MFKRWRKPKTMADDKKAQELYRRAYFGFKGLHMTEADREQQQQAEIEYHEHMEREWGIPNPVNQEHEDWASLRGLFDQQNRKELRSD